MRAFIFYVTGCGRCPYRDSDRDGDNYCAASEGYAEARSLLIQENSEGLTPTCPMFEESEEP